MGTVLTQFTVDGVALWVVLLICGGVFLGSFMDAIAGGGGIITVPTYLMGLSDFPIYNALGTNKLSSSIGTVFSTVRFIRQGYVDWVLFAPAIVLALGGSVCGTWAPAPHSGGGAEVFAAVGAAGGGVHHAADPQMAGRAGAAGPKAPPPHCLGRPPLVIGGYDGYYGPGTGTFLMIIFVRFARPGYPPCGRRREGHQSFQQPRQPVYGAAGRICTGGRGTDLRRGGDFGPLHRRGAGH